MRVGDSVRFDQYRERINAGDDFAFEFEINEDDAAHCATPLKGDPVDGTGVTVTASARVAGTFARLQVIVTKTSNGSSTEPMTIRVRVDSGDALMALADGAMGTFAIQARVRIGTVKHTVLKGRVTVLDAASRDILA